MTKTSEYCFFTLNWVKFSIVHVNRDVGRSSTGWLSAVLATSVCATTANSQPRTHYNQDHANGHNRLRFLMRHNAEPH